MNMANEKIEQYVMDRAHAIGFDLAGICSIDSGERTPFLDQWLARGFHGNMKYMENPKRLEPESVLPGIRTMIVVGLNYRREEERDQEAMISKYAWGADYHRVMKPMLEELAEAVRLRVPGCAALAYVDTGPLVEKHWAEKAGLGWIGKHTNVLNRELSSWFFIGSVLTDVPMASGAPAKDYCGTCVRCIEACPTRAIVAPYVLDARLCISYLTIELRESIPRELRSMIGHRIFGCDDCQDVCPWNRFARSGDPRFNPRPEVFSTRLLDYLSLTPDKFRLRFAGTNVLRAKYRGFLRNCLVAAGNSRAAELRPEIERHLQSEDEMIREHAVWALAQFKDDGARRSLAQLQRVEKSPSVLAEINHWMS